jgi:hypothetical protein
MPPPAVQPVPSEAVPASLRSVTAELPPPLAKRRTPRSAGLWAESAAGARSERTSAALMPERVNMANSLDVIRPDVCLATAWRAAPAAG